MQLSKTNVNEFIKKQRSKVNVFCFKNICFDSQINNIAKFQLFLNIRNTKL